MVRAGAAEPEPRRREAERGTKVAAVLVIRSRARWCEWSKVAGDCAFSGEGLERGFCEVIIAYFHRSIFRLRICAG